jgi:site-specific recombinase XerD
MTDEEKKDKIVYRQNRGYEVRKIQKTKREKFMTVPEIEQLLKTVEETNMKKMRRDHCAIYLGFYFGMRIGELRHLTRETFRDIEQGVVYVKRLKSSDRIKYICPHCQKKCKCSSDRIGTEFPCCWCGVKTEVKMPKKAPHVGPKEKALPMVEGFVIDYIKNYMTRHMRPDQHYFIEGSKSNPLSTQQLSKIFSTYIQLAGLNDHYSWHSLRHGRGVFLWERFQDLVVTRDMLGQASISAAEIYTQLSPQALAEKQKKLESGVQVKSNLTNT